MSCVAIRPETDVVTMPAEVTRDQKWEPGWRHRRNSRKWGGGEGQGGLGVRRRHSKGNAHTSGESMLLCLGVSTPLMYFPCSAEISLRSGSAVTSSRNPAFSP